jgi:hypothetical protein
MSWSRRGAIGAAAAAAVVLSGCTPGPLSSPKLGAPLGSGPALSSEESSTELASARTRLMGTWDLVRLEAVPPTGGSTRVPIQASGTLTYDQFGNLTIDAHTTDPAAPVAARERNLLSFQGRAAIDVAKSELKLMDLTGNVDPNEVLSPERRRRFEFSENSLTLSAFDDKGQVTSVAVWHRRN